jgi:hypothetical protein
MTGELSSLSRPIDWTRITHVIFRNIERHGVWNGRSFVWPDPWIDFWDDYPVMQTHSWDDVWEDDYLGGT